MLWVTICAGILSVIVYYGAIVATAGDGTNRETGTNEPWGTNLKNDRAKTDTQPLYFGASVKMKSTGVFQDGPVSIKLNPFIAGRLAYSYVNQATAENRFMILETPDKRNQSIQNVNSLNQSDLVLTNYPLEKHDAEVLNPIWSEDGRYILLKWGTRFLPTKSYQLYVLDTQTHQLKVVSDKWLANLYVSWSPDSNYVSYINPSC